MLVSTIAITVAVAAGVVGWRFVQGGGGGSSGERGEWDEIALVDRSTGTITRLDAEARTIDTAVGLGPVRAIHTLGDRLVLVGTDQIVLAAPDAEPATIAVERNSTVVPIRTPGRLHLAIGSESGGNVLIVDATSGDVLDIGSLADEPEPRMFVATLRWASDATAFAIGDANALKNQTIVVRPGEPGAIFLPDQPIAIADGLVATSQVVGGQADVTLLDFDRRSQAFVPTEVPAGGILDGDRLVMVSEDGGIYRVDKGAEDADRIGAVAVPAGDRVAAVHPIAGGERLVVSGPTFEAIVDLDGKTVFTTSFASPVAAVVPERGWSCLPVGGAASGHSLVDATNGEVLADLTGLSLFGTSSDGCAVLGERDGAFELVEAGGTVALGTGRVAVIGPGGRTVVRTAADGRVDLLRIDGDLELEDAVEIAPAGSFNTTVAFLDR